MAQDLIFDTILMPDEQGALRSRVLRQWERIDDRHYRIQLDPGLRFSDGSPVRSEDLVAILAEQQLRATVHGEWLEIESLPGQALVEPTLLDVMVYKKTGAAILGTASFRLVEQTETRIVLERIRPTPRRIQRVEIIAFPSSRDMLARVIRGDVNGAIGLNERQLELVDGIPGLKPIRNYSPTSLMVTFNVHRLDLAIRRQLAASLPLEEIGRAFSESCQVERAAGTRRQEVPPGPRLDILVPQYTPPLDLAAVALRRALGSRGGEIIRLELEELAQRWGAGQYDVALGAFGVWPDSLIASTWNTGGTQNLLKYSNPRVDEALARNDLAAAKAELAADVPVIILCRRERIGVVDSRIKNARMSWWGILDTLQDWEVEE